VGAGEAAHGERHRHCIVGPAEEAAQVRAAPFAPLAPAQHRRQQFVAGNVDGRTAHRRHPRVDELAQSWIVIAEHRHSQLKQFVGVAGIAQQRGHLVGRHAGIGHEAVWEKFHRAALGHAAQNLPLHAIDRPQIVDELAMFDTAIRIGRNKGVFVRCLSGTFDCPDAGREFHGFFLRQKKTRVLSPEGRFWGRPQHTGKNDYTQPAR